jgi:hypothetical protein
MQKPKGYDEAVAMIPGEGRQLPPGGYIGKIVYAEEATSNNGNEMVVLDVDIAEGEYTNFFRDKYDMRMTDGQPWGAKVRQVKSDDKPGFFKGFTEAIEQSNPSFKFPFDPRPLSELRGKKIGLVFGRDEFLTNDGEYKWATRVRGVRSVDAIRKGVKTPEDKPMQRPQGRGAGTRMTPSDEDLPF